MSFYVDPWLYNCAANPADSPEAQAEQRTMIEAVQRAVSYAIHHGVTPFAALGNESTDLGAPDSDPTSPDYPSDKAYDRTVDNSCLTVPAETVGVTSVSVARPERAQGGLLELRHRADRPLGARRRRLRHQGQRRRPDRR